MVYDIKDFQHELDSRAASAIFSNSVTKSVLRQLQKTNLESIYEYMYASSCPQLSEKSAPKLHRQLVAAYELFGLRKIPKIFVTRKYDEMVTAIGVNDPIIVFSTEYLRKLEGETRFGILSGQIAAIRSEHHRIGYLMWALRFAASLIPIPGVSLTVEPLINEWIRNRHFTYDRAFALATKSRTLSLRQILLNVVPRSELDKMACGTKRDAFEAQAKNFVSGMSNVQNGVRTAVQMFTDKDWLPLRYHEVNKFFDERRL